MADLLSSQFGTIDTDSDGLLTETEFTAAEDAMKSGGAGGMQGMSGPPPGPPPSGPPPGAENEAENEDDTTTSSSATSAQSLYESLFTAMTSESGSSEQVTTARDTANQFLSLLKAVA
ncbi:hypothetical protein AP071_09480 [Rhodobacter capsulatus]|nr:hypothetical protein AP073_08275 [Rhodobacter capsulatus]KQB11726.1 hypothetical protein AP071_09480 [Rhodobacter capsulatus]